MKGHVDAEMRALVPVHVGRRGESAETKVMAWVDTAFNGSLVLPQDVAVDASLAVESIAEAILADGSQVEVETFGCAIKWLGKTYDTQVITSTSKYGLIGTALLVDRKLTIDYKTRTVQID